MQAQPAHAFRRGERRGRFRELTQVDNSPHICFPGKGSAPTLLAFIDDATGRLVHLRCFAEGSRLRSCARLMKTGVKKRGGLTASPERYSTETAGFRGLPHATHTPDAKPAQAEGTEH